MIFDDDFFNIDPAKQDSEFSDDFFDIPAQPEYEYSGKGFLGAMGDLGRGLWEGTLDDLVGGAFQLGEWVAPSGSPLEDAFAAGDDYITRLLEFNPELFQESQTGEEARKEDWLNPRGWLHPGMKSVGPMVGAALTGPAAPATIGLLYYGRTAQEAYDDSLDKFPEWDEDKRLTYANTKGVIEGGGEAIQMALFRGLWKAMPAPAKGKLLKGAAGAVRPGVGFLKRFLGMVAGEEITETGQEYTGRATDFWYGLEKEMPTVTQSFKDVFGPTLLASTIMGSGGSVAQMQADKRLNQNLSHIDTPRDVRTEAAATVYQRLQKKDSELADRWWESVKENLALNNPITIGDDVDYKAQLDPEATALQDIGEEAVVEPEGGPTVEDPFDDTGIPFEQVAAEEGVDFEAEAPVDVTDMMDGDVPEAESPFVSMPAVVEDQLGLDGDVAAAEADLGLETEPFPVREQDEDVPLFDEPAVEQGKVITAESQIEDDIAAEEEAERVLPADQRRKLKAEAKKELEDNPVFAQMREIMKRPIRIADVKYLFDSGKIQDIPNFRRLFTNKGNMYLDEVADEYGYESDSAMLEAFRNAGTQKAAIEKSYQGKVSEWFRAESQMQDDLSMAELEEAVTGRPVKFSLKKAVPPIGEPAISGQGENLDTLTQEPGEAGIKALVGEEKKVSPDHFEGPHGTNRFVKRDDTGKIIGSVQVYSKGASNVVTGIYVAPDQRRQKVGSDLIDTARKNFPNLQVSQFLTEPGAQFFGLAPKKGDKAAEWYGKLTPGRKKMVKAAYDHYVANQDLISEEQAISDFKTVIEIRKTLSKEALKAQDRPEAEAIAKDFDPENEYNIGYDYYDEMAKTWNFTAKGAGPNNEFATSGENDGASFGVSELTPEAFSQRFDDKVEEYTKKVDIKFSLRDTEVKGEQDEEKRPSRDRRTPEDRSTDGEPRIDGTPSEKRLDAEKEIQLDDIRKAFPTGSIQVVDGGYIVDLPNGSQIYVNLVGEIAIDREVALKAGYTEEQIATLSPAGTWVTFADEAGIIQLSKIAGIADLNHETFHAAMELVLTPEEVADVLSKFEREEGAAEAYGQWAADQDAPHTAFQKVKKFFRNIVDNLLGGEKAVFARIKSGKPFGRAVRATMKQRVPVSQWTPDMVMSELVERNKYSLERFKPVDTDSVPFKSWFGDSKVVDEDGNPMVVHHGGLGIKTADQFEDGYGGQTTGNNDIGAFHFTDDLIVAEDYGRQSFVRRFQDDPESLISEGVIAEDFDLEEVDAYEFVDELAEDNIETKSVYLSMENPIELDMEGQVVDVQQIEDISKFAKDGVDETGEMWEQYADQMYSEFDPGDIENNREGIEETARENFGLDEDEKIEEYMFKEATQDYLIDQGFEQQHTPIDGIIIRNMIDNIGDASNRIADQYIIFDPTRIKSATSNTGDFSNSDARIKYSLNHANHQANIATKSQQQLWYSDMVRSIDGISDKARPQAQWQKDISELADRTKTKRVAIRDDNNRPTGESRTVETHIPGQFRRSELEWSGVLPWLSGQSGKVSKQKVMDYLDANLPKLGEVVLSEYADRPDNEVRQYFDDIQDDLIANDGSTSISDDMGNTLKIEMEFYDPAEDTATVTVYDDENNTVENYLGFEEFVNGVTTQGDFDGFVWPVARHDDYQMLGPKSGYRELVITLDGEDLGFRRAEHFPVKNVVVHARFNTRADAAGRRTLHVEELQSDHLQAGRKKGYVTLTRKETDRLEELEGISVQERELTGEEEVELERLESKAGAEYKERGEAGKGVPDAPFKKEWPALMMKRLLRWAVDNGYDQLTWTTGAQQADRFSNAFRYSVDKINWKLAGGVYEINAEKAGKESFYADFDMDGNAVSEVAGFTGRPHMSEIIGKNLSGKIIGSDKSNGSFEGDDLTVGAEGFKAFYDQELVNTVKKIVRPFGSTVETADINVAEAKDLPDVTVPVHSIEITPKMRETVPGGASMWSRAKYSLREFAAPDTSSAQFKKWFGDSKVVDADGNPLVVYHGTRTLFDAFTPGADSEMGGSSGIFFTDDHDVAANYAGSADNALESDQGVHEVYLKVDRLLEYDANGADWASLMKPEVWVIRDEMGEVVQSYEYEKDAEVFFDDYNEDFVEEYGIEPGEYGEIVLAKELDEEADGTTTDEVFAQAVEDGYDGVLVKNVLDVAGEGAENLTDPSNIYIIRDPTQIKSAISNTGAFSATDPRIKYSLGTSEPWYSTLGRAAGELKQQKGSPDQMLAMLKKSPGVKQEEIEWVGLEEWMAGKKSVTKDEIVSYLDENDVQLEEVFKGVDEGEIEAYLADELGEGQSREEAIDYLSRDEGGPKFSDYQLPGGENYRELLITLPVEVLPEGWTRDSAGNIIDSVGGIVPPDSPVIEFIMPYQGYRGPHYEEANILAHVRFNERVDADGQKVLFIEEIQSDWHQAGRKKGYSAERIKKQKELQAEIDRLEPLREAEQDRLKHARLTDRISELKTEIVGVVVDHGVPDAPFKKTWNSLALKRIITYASQNGFDKVAWTTGEQQNERYDLSKQVREISYIKNLNNTYDIEIVLDQDNDDRNYSSKTAEELADIIGKEATEKIVSGENKDGSYDDGAEYGKLENADLKIGGEGMKGFYDSILPSAANKLIKKYGGRVGETDIATKTKPKHDRFEIIDPDGSVVKNVRTELIAEDLVKQFNKRTSSATGFTYRDTGAPQQKQSVHSFNLTPPLKAKALGGMPKFSLVPGKTKPIQHADKMTGLIERLQDNQTDILTKQRELARYIQRSLPIPERGRRELISAITKLAVPKTKATRLKYFQQALEYIDSHVEKVEHKEGIDKIAAKLKSLEPKKEKGKEVGKLGADTHAMLRKIQGVINMDPATAAEAHENAMKAIGETMENITPDQQEQIYLLSRFADLKNRNSVDVWRALEDIVTIEETGRFLFNIHEDARKARNEKLAGVALNEFTGKEDVTLDDIIKQKRQRKQDEKTLMGSLHKSISSFDSMHQSWEWMLDKLSKYSKDTGVLQGATTDHFRRTSHSAQTDFDFGVSQQTDRMKESAERIFGASKRGLEKILIGNAVQVENTGVHTYKEGTAEEIPMSQNEAYKLWQWMQDPSLKENLAIHGYTVDTLAELEKFMTPEIKEWAEWQLYEFYPSYYKEINDVYRRMYHVDLPYNPMYSPMVRERGAELTDDLLLQANTPYASVMNGSLKLRVDNKIPPRLSDGDAILSQHVAQMEHFKAWAEPVREMRSVLGSSKVQGAIEAYHGTSAKTVIQKFIDDFARGGADRAQVLKGLDLMRANFVKAVIGVNPVVFAKQLTSFPAYATDMPVHMFLKGVADFATNPVKKSRVLMTSKKMKARYEKGWERDIAAAMKKAAPAGISEVKNLTDLLMLPTKVGDKWAIMMGGWAQYKYNYDRYRKAGMPKEKAHNKAIVDFEMATERSQQSRDAKDQGHFQRGGSMYKLFTMFMTSPQAYYRHIAGGYRNLINQRGSAAENIKRIAIAQFVLPMIFQFVASGFDWEDEDQLRAILMGPFNGLFIMKDLVEPMVEVLATGKMPRFSNELPIFTPAKSLGYALVEANKLIRGDDGDIGRMVDKTLSGLSKTPIPWLGGIPYDPMKRVATGMYAAATGQTEHPKRRAMGFSKYALERDEEISPRRGKRVARKVRQRPERRQ